MGIDLGFVQTPLHDSTGACGTLGGTCGTACGWRGPWTSPRTVNWRVTSAKLRVPRRAAAEALATCCNRGAAGAGRHSDRSRASLNRWSAPSSMERPARTGFGARRWRRGSRARRGPWTRDDGGESARLGESRRRGPATLKRRAPRKRRTRLLWVKLGPSESRGRRWRSGPRRRRRRLRLSRSRWSWKVRRASWAACSPHRLRRQDRRRSPSTGRRFIEDVYAACSTRFITTGRVAWAFAGGVRADYWRVARPSRATKLETFTRGQRRRARSGRAAQKRAASPTVLVFANTPLTPAQRSARAAGRCCRWRDAALQLAEPSRAPGRP